jgi:hypothetical protein
VRGFTVVYQETYVKTAKLQILGLKKCLVKRIYTDCVHRYWYTIVRGFTVVHQKTYVRNGRDLENFVFWCDVKTIHWLCIYHCERIHSGISKNLRQKWQRFEKLWFDEMFRKRTILLIMSIPWWEDSQWYIHKTDLDKNITVPYYWYWYVHTTVRGFTVVYHQTCVRFGRGLPGLMWGRWKI